MPSLSSTLGNKAAALFILSVVFMIAACGAESKPQQESGLAPSAPPRQEGPQDEDLEVLRQSDGELRITIDQIRTDVSMSGHVTGLSEGAVADFKVVVYAHTDQWYVHPFAGQGEGMSWAAINRDLSWSIQTVRREYVADQVAALLVPATADPPRTTRDLSMIPSRAWVVIRGTGQL